MSNISKKNKKKLWKKKVSFKPQTNDLPYLTYMKHLTTKTLDKDSMALIFLDTVDMDNSGIHHLQQCSPECLEDLTHIFYHENTQTSNIKLSNLKLIDVIFNDIGFFNFIFSHENKKILLSTHNIEQHVCTETLYDIEQKHSVEHSPIILFENFSHRSISFDCLYFQSNINKEPIVSMTFIEPYDELKEETKRRIFTISFSSQLSIREFKD